MDVDLFRRALDGCASLRWHGGLLDVVVLGSFFVVNYRSGERTNPLSSRPESVYGPMDSLSNGNALERLYHAREGRPAKFPPAWREPAHL